MLIVDNVKRLINPESFGLTEIIFLQGSNAIMFGLPDTVFHRDCG